MAGTEIAKIEEIGERYPVLAGDMAGEFREIMAENLGDGGVSGWDLDRIKIPAGGGKAWEVPTLDGFEARPVIEGVIVGWESPRSYWATSLDDSDGDGGSPPDCSSPDGKYGNGLYGPGSDENPTGACEVCPMDEFEEGGGKPCKETRALFFLLEGQMLPVIVSLPPTSIRPLRKHMLRLAGSGVPYYGATTKLALEQVKGKFTYSVVVPSLGQVLPPEGRAAAKAYGDAIASLGGGTSDATPKETPVEAPERRTAEATTA